MALKIRLARHGATHNPVYRVVVAESTFRRDGRFVEWIGTYAPRDVEERQLTLKLDRAEYWMSVGAKPTETVASLIKKTRKLAQAESTAEAAS